MVTFGQRLKELRKREGLTQEQLADKFYLNKSSVSRYENNTQLPENEQLQKMADFFNTSVDYLLGRSENEWNPTITNKDTKDIEKALNKTLESLESQEGLMLSGSPVDEDDWELLKAAIQNGLEYAKKMNKQKYTPKKYRK